MGETQEVKCFRLPPLATALLAAKRPNLITLVLVGCHWRPENAEIVAL
jgi:hypothetical protein